MGYYFQKARSPKDLNEEQLARYNQLRSPENDEEHAPELLRRYQEVKDYIGPLTSGEIMSAHEELVQDTVVTWILAGEDPSKVEWSDPKDLVIPEPEPTEEEKLERTRRYNERYPPETPQQLRDRQWRQVEMWGFCDQPSALSPWQRFRKLVGWY